MSDDVKSEVVSLPILTVEEKLAIRDLQVEIVSIDNNLIQLQHRAEDLKKSLSSFLNKLVEEKSVDKTKFGFNIQQLAFYPLEKEPEKVL